jgi:tetratricopeptide (TPR) repeat protein
MDVADADLELTVIEIESGNLDEASRYTRAAGKIFDAVAPNGAPLASVAIREGLIAFRKQQFDVALAAFERGLSIRRRTGASIPMIAVAISDVAEALVELGRPDEALIRLEQAERLAATAPGTTFDLEAALDKVRGLALLAKGSRQLAIPPLERALSRLENPGSSLELADVRWALARSLPPRGGSIDTRACSLAESARKRYQELGAAGRAPSGIIQHWQMNAHCARSL